jgi:hypothetical protein
MNNLKVGPLLVTLKVIKVVGFREHIPAIFVTEMEWNQLVSPCMCVVSLVLVATNELPRQGFLLSLFLCME